MNIPVLGCHAKPLSEKKGKYLSGVATQLFRDVITEKCS